MKIQLKGTIDFLTLYPRRLAALMYVVWMLSAAPVQAWFWSPDPYEGESHLEELTRISRLEGRDNALIHYIKAAQLIKPCLGRYIPAGGQGDDRLPDCRRLDDPKLEALVKAAEPIIAEATRGAAVRYARDLSMPKKAALERGPNAHLYDDSIEIIIQALASKGCLLERRQKHDKAMEPYLIWLTMGRDIGTDASKRDISGRLQVGALKQIDRLITSGKLQKKTLVQTLQQVRRVEAGQVDYAVYFREQTQRWPSEMEAFLERQKSDPKLLQQLASTSQTLQMWIENEREDFRRIHSMMLIELKVLETPWWQRDLEKAEAEQGRLINQLTGMQGRIYRSVPTKRNFLWPDLQAHLLKTETRAAELIAALELARIEQEQYPDRLEALCPEYLNPLPTDPFNGQDFHYERTNEGQSYRLWSVGPDVKDDEGRAVYVPAQNTTGVHPLRMTIRPGDLLFHHPR
jgi:hypothetical protein